MKPVWEIIANERDIKRKKAKYCYNDHKGGYSIEGLLAEGIQTGVTEDPSNNISEFLREYLDCIVLSRELAPNPFFEITAMQVREIPLWVVKNMFKSNLIQNDGKTSIRELAILNDQTQMDLKDFQEVFEDLDI
jgi:hypothetical protein